MADSDRDALAGARRFDDDLLNYCAIKDNTRKRDCRAEPCYSGERSGSPGAVGFNRILRLFDNVKIVLPNNPKQSHN